MKNSNQNQKMQTMQCFEEWQNTKTYEGHIQRLIQIQTKPKSDQKKKIFRVKSQPNKLNKTTSLKKQHLPLPLVSKNQKRLLSNVMESNSMNLKQKQTLLQNYLLGKRILQTHSVFNSKEIKKQFRFHKMVSKNMNKGLRYNRIAISAQRETTFTKYESLKQNHLIGKGRLCLSFRINNIIFIKKNLQQNQQTAYNLIFKPKKGLKYTSKALNFKQLTSIHLKYLIKKKDFQKQQGIRYEIQNLRGNNSHKMCYFNIKSSDFLNQKEGIQKVFQKLFHPITNKLIGSIQLECQIKNLSVFNNE